MKCPLCDGPVVNGRCRQCGMPYKNDELLYHLNEDRRTHEKHATDKAKEELLKRMVPLGDTAKQTSRQPEVKRNLAEAITVPGVLRKNPRKRNPWEALFSGS